MHISRGWFANLPSQPSDLSAYLFMNLPWGFIACLHRAVVGWSPHVRYITGRYHIQCILKIWASLKMLQMFPNKSVLYVLCERPVIYAPLLPYWFVSFSKFFSLWFSFQNCACHYRLFLGRCTSVGNILVLHYVTHPPQKWGFKYCYILCFFFNLGSFWW